MTSKLMIMSSAANFEACTVLSYGIVGRRVTHSCWFERGVWRFGLSRHGWLPTYDVYDLDPLVLANMPLLTLLETDGTTLSCTVYNLRSFASGNMLLSDFDRGDLPPADSTQAICPMLQNGRWFCV